MVVLDKFKMKEKNFRLMHSNVYFQRLFLTQNNKKRSAKDGIFLINCLRSSKRKKMKKIMYTVSFPFLLTPWFLFMNVPCIALKTSKLFHSTELESSFALNHSTLVKSMQAAVNVCVLLKSVLASSAIRMPPHVRTSWTKSELSCS